MPKKGKKLLSLDEELSKIQRESDKSFSASRKSRAAFIILLAVFLAGNLVFSAGILLVLNSMDFHLEARERLVFIVSQTVSIFSGLALLFLLRRKLLGVLILVLSVAAIFLTISSKAVPDGMFIEILMLISGGILMACAFCLKTKTNKELN